MRALLFALWLVAIPALAGAPNYDAFSDAEGHIGTPQQVLAAQEMVRAPGQLEVVFADAARGNRRAARVFQELETRFFPDIGRTVAETSGALKCRTPVVKEFAIKDCQPKWQGLDFLPQTEAGARLRNAAIEAYKIRAKQLGIEDAAIIATVNAVLAVGGAAMVVHSAEARAAAAEAARVASTAGSSASELEAGARFQPRSTGAQAGYPKRVLMLAEDGRPCGEFDEIQPGKLVEDKSAKGLNVPNPKTGRPQQSAREWAKDQIFDGIKRRLDNLLTRAKKTAPSPGEPSDVPSLSEIRSIREYVVRVENGSPEVQAAVNEQLAESSKHFPGWKFYAIFGSR